MKKTLTFYKNNATDQWYLYIKWFPSFLRPLLLMVCGADRLLDILYLQYTKRETEKEILSYYQNKESCNILTIDITNNRPEDYMVKLRLNDNINKEFEFNRISNGRVYRVSKINLLQNTEFLNNNKNKYFDNLGLGNNIWLCFVTWFVCGFRYPKTIYASVLNKSFNYERLLHVVNIIDSTKDNK